MVAFIHAADDPGAGKDLARIYATNTLERVISVNRGNAKRTASELLDGNLTVVIPTAAERISDPLLKVLRVLELFGHPIERVDAYILSLNEPPAPAQATVHALPGSGVGDLTPAVR